MTEQKHILILAGDGIGPEVTAQAGRIIDWLNEKRGTKFTTSEALIGGIAYDETGSPLPQETIDAAKKSDAVLLGAVGGPKWEPLDISVRPEKGLLGIRKELQLFANLRPALVFDELAEASTLKKEIVSGLDIMIVRELTGGIYFGEPQGVEDLPDGTQKGYNTLVYTTPEIQRIARVALIWQQNAMGVYVPWIKLMYWSALSCGVMKYKKFVILNIKILSCHICM